MEKIENLYKKLSEYLDDSYISQLKMYFEIKPSIGVCLVVSEIMRTYNNPKNEKKVCDLLERYMKLYYNI